MNVRRPAPAAKPSAFAITALSRSVNSTRVSSLTRGRRCSRASWGLPLLRKLAKSIKPGGRVAIIDFKPNSPEGPPKEFRFPLEKFKSEMGKAGYKLAAQHNFLPRQQFLIFEVAGPSSR